MRKQAAIFIAFLALAVFSCTKDNKIMHDSEIIGTVVNGRFVSDEGLFFNVVKNNCEQGLEDNPRSLIVCDILSKVNDKEYNIELKQIVPILLKDPVTASLIEDGNELGQDGIRIERAWKSGKYLNLSIEITTIHNSQTKHLINLVYLDSKSTADSLFFELRHNGFGEVFEAGLKNHKIVGSAGLVSFPILQLFPEDRKSVALSIAYPWYTDPKTSTQKDTLYTKGKISR